MLVRRSSGSLCQQLSLSVVIYLTHFSHKAVAALGHRFNELSSASTFAKCLTQHRNILVDVPFFNEFLRPHGTHQLFLVHQMTTVLNQHH